MAALHYPAARLGHCVQKTAIKSPDKIVGTFCISNAFVEVARHRVIGGFGLDAGLTRLSRCREQQSPSLVVLHGLAIGQ